MKKTLKQLISFILAIVLIVSTLSVNSYAYTQEIKKDDVLYVSPSVDINGKWVNLSKLRMRAFSTQSFRADINTNARLSVKSSKPSALKAVMTEYNYVDDIKRDLSNGSEGIVNATISLYATKTGTYTVTVTATLKDGTIRQQKIKVLVTSVTGVYKKIKYGKKTVLSKSGKISKGQLQTKASQSLRVTKKSGKLTVTPNSQYKITGIIVESVDKKGKAVYKKIKNGKNIKVSKGYLYTDTHANYNYSSRTPRKYTYVYISYKDKFTGDTYTYSISKDRGRKEVKLVTTDKRTGRKIVKYRPEVSLYLWNY